VETVRCLLRDLFRQVLSERGRALTGIGIESSVGRFDPRLVACFSNGHRAEVAARTEELCEFCERHSTWDLDGLRGALVNEGREIYAQMFHDLQVEVGGPHAYEPLLSETLEPDTTGRLRAWWNQLRFIRGYRLEQAVEREAHDCGLRLLIKNLSPAQRAQYDAFGYFEVIAGETGKRYRITRAYQMNVLEMGKNGKRSRTLCFPPKGGLVLGDVMLAQKLALESFESHALAVANAVIGQASPIFPMG
jgi:hypothetical protein